MVEGIKSQTCKVYWVFVMLCFMIWIVFLLFQYQLLSKPRGMFAMGDFRTLGGSRLTRYISIVYVVLSENNGFYLVSLLPPSVPKVSHSICLIMFFLLSRHNKSDESGAFKDIILKSLLSRKLGHFRGSRFSKMYVLYYQPLPITRYQVRFLC